MLGDYRDDEATKDVFMGDWIRTGDLAKRDEDGYIGVVDRKDDLIISGGVNIYPKEIEEVILRYSGIQEVAVFGIPNQSCRETVKAVIIGSEDIDMNQLHTSLQTH